MSLAGQTRTEDGVQIHYLPVTRRRDWSRLDAVRPLKSGVRTANEMLRDLTFHQQIYRTLRQQARPGDFLQWYIVGDFTWFVIRNARRRGWRNLIQISLVGADDPASFRSSLLGLSTRLKRNCFFLAERTIGLSRALTDSCLQAGIPQRQVLRIPNGVDTARFRPAGSAKNELKRQLGMATERRYLIFVGSAIHRKGIDVAVRAFGSLAPSVCDLDLLIVGPSDFHDRTRHEPARQQLVDQLRVYLTAAGCGERVHWIGDVVNVEDYLRASDLFLFPTRREGLPNAMAEAMACGLPVVAANLAGITTDLVNDGLEGRLISGHDPSDYARVLHNLMCQPEQLARMGSAACQRVADEFDLEQIVRQYAELYQNTSS